MLDRARKSRILAPGAFNAFHETYLGDVFRSLVGHGGPDLLAQWGLNKTGFGERVFHGDFFLLTMDAEPDAHLTYMNQKALQQWETSWEQMIGMPSRILASPDQYADRGMLMAHVREEKRVTDYEGDRVSFKGKHFRIKGATIWNVMSAEGYLIGQASYFTHVENLAPR